MTTRQRHSIAGVPFDFLKGSQVLDRIVGASHDKPIRIALANPHSVMTCRRRDDVREAIVGSDLILPDGVGVALAARMLTVPGHTRTPGPNLLRQVCDLGRPHGLRHYFYGGAPGVAERMVRSLSARYPGLQVSGSECPPFFEREGEQEAADCERINETNSDIVWVGLGAPKQELWMMRNTERLRARAVIGIGAAFDFESGRIRRAPRWVQQSGLEWAYRLTCEPGRLWRRNLDSPLFLFASLFGGGRAAAVSPEAP